MFTNDQVRIEGFATHDPVVTKTKTGKSLCKFSVAINHSSKPGEEPKVSYLDVETWEKTADICANTVTKGRRVMVFGAIRQDRWLGENGKMQSKIKIVGDEIRFIESIKSPAAVQAVPEKIAV
jgi:single-strand DNA-binding protein